MSAKKIGAAAVIVNSDGHVLLVKHGYGALNWELPGGGAEPSESVVDTAIRETREETGLIIEAERMTGVYYVSQSDSVHFVFQCKIISGEPKINDASEITDCRYWPADSLPRPMSDWTIRRIGDALADEHPHLPVLIESVTFLT